MSLPDLYSVVSNILGLVSPESYRVDYPVTAMPIRLEQTLFLLMNFGSTGSNARSRIGILAGLLLVLERILPIVMYTGQASLSPEKLVRCAWLDNPIMGTTVDPAGKAFYQGTEGISKN